MIVDLNINGVLFHVEASAAEDLKAYINAIRRYFSGYENNYEIIADIENRIAEFLLFKLTKKNEIIGCEEVKSLIDSMGAIEGFQAESLVRFKEYDTEAPLPKKLYRDEKRKLIGGVASGLAYYLGLDPLFIRLIFLLSFLNYFNLLSITGSVTLTYLILWLLIPGSFKLRDNIKVKNFYRDGIDKVIGGVSGGVGAYFGIETNIVRILFFAGMFLGGFSLVLYIILWVISPEAVSLTQRMQMKGERITLENIEQRISATLKFKEGDKEKYLHNISYFINCLTSRLNFTKLSKSLNRVLKMDHSNDQKLINYFNRIGEIIKERFFASISYIKNNFHYVTAALKYITQAFSGLTILAISLVFSIILFLILEAFLGIVDFEWMQYLSYDYFIIPIEIARQTVAPATSIFTVSMLWIPVFYLGIYGMRLVVRKKILNSYINWSLFGLWVFALIGSASTIPLLFQNFNTKGVFVNNAKFEVPSTTLKIDLASQHEYPTFRDVKVTLKGHQSKDIELVEKFQAKGKTRQEAIENAKKIMYSVSLDDSLLQFSNSFGLDSGVPFRSQEVQLELYIPYYKEFVMSESLGRILLHTLYPKGYNISQLGEKNRWVYTEDGLECITCGDEEKNEFVNPDYEIYSKTNILVKEFDHTNFRNIKIKGAFDVEILKSKNYKIVAEGESEVVRKLNVRDKEGTILIVDKESLKLDTAKNHSHVSFVIHTPTLEKVLFFGPIQAQISGFEQEELEVYMKGMADCKIEADINKLGIEMDGVSTLNLVGKGDVLELDLNGDAEVNAYQFQANIVLARTQNTSIAKVFAAKSLKMKSTNQSKVMHKGNPMIDCINE